jgi:hypothetical protein
MSSQLNLYCASPCRRRLDRLEVDGGTVTTGAFARAAARGNARAMNRLFDDLVLDLDDRFTPHARYRAEQDANERLLYGPRFDYRCGAFGCGAHYQWKHETVLAACKAALAAGRTSLEVGLDLPA